MQIATWVFWMGMAAMAGKACADSRIDSGVQSQEVAPRISVEKSSPDPGKTTKLPPRQRRRIAIEGLIESSGDAALQRFVDEHLAPQYRDSFAAGALLEHLRAIRAACSGFGGVIVEPAGDDAARIRFLQGNKEPTLLFRIEHEPPHRITALELGPIERQEAPPALAPLTWETLAPRLEAEAKNGFSGAVLAVHDGKIVLHQGYGFADRADERPNTTQTMFAIGSVPIDFTHAAILKLEELGKLRTSDTIVKFLDGVPAEKSSITLDQLMTGKSGLPNFHGIQGVDADPDLTWIDRATAIRRILEQDLLFTPGQGQAHSHSAWVLLAAIVEIVSQQSYQDFLQQHFFGPAGMTRTGQHEDAARLSDDEFAIGYEGRPSGEINTPKHWGKTSWLVMGSGGMYSTPEDLYKWLVGIRSGKTLSAAQASRYWSHGVLAGGDMRGFLCVYTEGPQDLFILCSNAHSRRGDHPSQVADALAELVRGASMPPYTLGIELAVDSEGHVKVQSLMPQGAAERDGLKEGDLLLSAKGVPLRDPVQPILALLLRTGEPIPLEIERAGERRTITVKPMPRR